MFAKKEIGGYFELELPRSNDIFIHASGVMVNSGRHALEYILSSIGRDIRKLFLPYYTCEVIWEPIKRLGIPYEFYHVDIAFEISDDIVLAESEYLIANNYYGIKDKYISKLADRYGDQLIVDNAQAWYAPEIPGVNSFYSPRKFFGLPDGGVAFTQFPYDISLEKGFSSSRCNHLFRRIDYGASAGYGDFQNNSTALSKEGLTSMSDLTFRMLSSIDFKEAQRIRLDNYRFLSSYLDQSNGISLPEMDSFACPMVYPYYTEDTGLRKRLIENKIFVATYWPNVLVDCPEHSVEYELTKNVLPLPIDQRYTEDDMTCILNIITR